MAYFHKLALSSLSGLLGLTALTSIALANPSASTEGMVDHVCFMELSGGSVVNLEHLCGPSSYRSMGRFAPGSIDLSGGDSPLTAEMQQLRTALSQARNSREIAALREGFNSRLPYSNRVRNLQAQERNLLWRLEDTSTQSRRDEIARQINDVRRQIRQDPSYQAVRQARNQAYGELNP